MNASKNRLNSAWLRQILEIFKVVSRFAAREQSKYLESELDTFQEVPSK